MIPSRYFATLVLASTLLAAAVTTASEASPVPDGSPASATCRIHNDTRWDFKVKSGNTSNQSVDSHTTTSITEGKIKGKDENSGKTISGYCRDGDEVEIKEDGGVPVLTVK